jgi:hypothetical protein
MDGNSQNWGEDEHGNLVDYNQPNWDENRSADLSDDEYITDGYEGGPIFYYDSEEHLDDDIRELSPKVISSRCSEGCIGETDPVTLEKINKSDNAIFIDKQCYTETSLKEALRHNGKLPHNRSQFSLNDLDMVLMRENDNEC